ncbi:GNAT family N-acetyltransferase [Polycladidibacter hongkongensis]|uniref:GNAT family N-acetyltransferase n=1 Tax=Polycladidibacter hongkongensis TaxID=1647556 RepID=UPI001AD8CFD5|nr:GNAT family N-acetyltransferase [Pseudovibrio hongkongensis]
MQLRAPKLTDCAASQALWSDPLVYRYIREVPQTYAKAHARLMTYAGLWALHGYGYFCVEERDSGKFVGEAGFGSFDRGLGTHFDDAPEAGWVMCSQIHGNGYGRELLQMLCYFADEVAKFPRSVAMIDPHNAASLAVARRAGFKAYDKASFEDSEVLLFERLRGARA